MVVQRYTCNFAGHCLSHREVGSFHVHTVKVFYKLSLIFNFFITLNVYACTHVHPHSYHGTCMKIWVQFVETGSFLLPRWPQELNQSHPSWWQTSLPTVPFLLRFTFIKPITERGWLKPPGSALITGEARPGPGIHLSTLPAQVSTS